MKVGEAVVDIVGKTKPLDKSLKDAQGRVKSSMQKMQKAMLPVGMAFTATGAAGLAMIQSTKKINAALGVTALNLGVTTKEMRELTLATTNVTFPIKEVTATFDLLARAGVTDTEVLKQVATAFDTLGDATGRSASQVTQMMIPAMKTFGLTATEMAEKTDIMTYMSRKSTMSMEDFNTMVGYTTPELVKAGLTMEDLTAALIYMERRGYAPGRVMTREFMKATTLATKEQIPLTEALGMTTEELQGLKDELEGATGMTQEYADVANEQYTIMDKLKQKWSELTLMASEYLEPLEPILAGMTALGPLMIGLSMVGIPKLIIAIKSVGHALKTLLLNPVVALIAAIGLLGYGIYALIKHQTDWNDVVKAAARVQDELARSGGEMTQGVLDASNAYIELREAYGQLTPEEEAHIERTKELIGLYKDGALKVAEYTKSFFQLKTETEGLSDAVLGLTFQQIQQMKIGGQVTKEWADIIMKRYGEVTEAGIAWNDVISARAALNAAIALSEGQVTEEVKKSAEAYIELREAYGVVTPAEEAYIEGLKEAIKATVKLRKESEKLAGSLRKTVADAYMYYATLGRPLTAFEREQMAAFGGKLGIPGLQGGGIIDKPTLAMLGEQAPGIKEFVFNERQLGMLGGKRVANIYIEVDGRMLARVIGQPLIDEIRIRTGAKL